MEATYPYILALHLLCAIIFLGFIFTDVVLLSLLSKALGEELVDKIFSLISKRGVKIMPICLFLLSGGAMISRYVGTTQGFFDKPLQVLLMIKVVLALCIVCMVLGFFIVVLKKEQICKKI